MSLFFQNMPDDGRGSESAKLSEKERKFSFENRFQRFTINESILSLSLSISINLYLIPGSMASWRGKVKR